MRERLSLSLVVINVIYIYIYSSEIGYLSLDSRSLSLSLSLKNLKKQVIMESNIDDDAVAIEREEDIYMIEKNIPGDIDSVLSLLRQVFSLLKPSPALVDREEFFTDDVSYAGGKTYTKASVELDGCLLRKAKVETKFAPLNSSSTSTRVKSTDEDERYSTPQVTGPHGFMVELATNLETPWVLEQALSSRKSVQESIERLTRIKAKLRAAGKRRREDGDDYLSLLRGLHADLKLAIHSTVEGRNAFFLPNPLSFPQTFRPFNGLTPPLSRDYHLEFYIFRNRLVISSFYLVPTTLPPSPHLPDIWFDDDYNRFVDLVVPTKVDKCVQIKAEHTVSFQVAHFAKALTLLQESIDILANLTTNVFALVDRGGDVSSSMDKILMPVSLDSAVSWI